jgi:hypothetical protein
MKKWTAPGRLKLRLQERVISKLTPLLHCIDNGYNASSDQVGGGQTLQKNDPFRKGQVHRLGTGKS